MRIGPARFIARCKAHEELRLHLGRGRLRDRDESAPELLVQRVAAERMSKKAKRSNQRKRENEVGPDELAKEGTSPQATGHACAQTASHRCLSHRRANAHSGASMRSSIARARPP